MAGRLKIICQNNIKSSSFTRRGLQSRSENQGNQFFISQLVNSIEEVQLRKWTWLSQSQLCQNLVFLIRTAQAAQWNWWIRWWDCTSIQHIDDFYLLFPGLQRTTERGGSEGTDRTRFLWRKPSETEANICTALLSCVLPCHGSLARRASIKFPLTTKVFPWQHILPVLRVQGVNEGPKSPMKQPSNQLQTQMI